MVLTLATILAPAVSVFAMPGDFDSAMQHETMLMDATHQGMDHAGMSMDPEDSESCCDPGDCGDCEQNCGTCVMSQVLVLNPSLAAACVGVDHYPAGIDQLFSNIPPPPNKPPV
jgi:hypothetical protein